MTENNQDISKTIDKLIFRKGEIIIEEIIEQSFRLLCNKLAYGGLNAENEIAFQCELGIMLKTLGQLYEFETEDKFQIDFETIVNLDKETIKSKTKNARIDILIKYTLNGKITKAAIELKFFKKKNHREPNNRYDVFKDISNLEQYKTNDIDICYFILVTDHDHYVNKQDYSKDTADFDFKHGSYYKAGTVLSYRTKKPYGPDLKLRQDYEFRWGNVQNLYFLKLKV